MFLKPTRFIYFVLFTISIIISCSKKQLKVYPFSQAQKVEVISYPNRELWDFYGNDEIMNNGVISNGRIRIKKSKIKDRLLLTELQEKELFDILYNSNCNQVMSAACYEPRHAFIFYDNKKSAFAALEICFECSNYQTTKGFARTEFCFEKMTKLSTFLKSIGIKYFGQGE